MMEKLTLQQRLHNAFGVQAVENIKTEHAYLHAASHSFEEWDTLWSRSDDITWAHGFGRMVGWDEVWYGSVWGYDADVINLYLQLLDQYPEVNGKDPRACGLGGLHSLASGVVEVAEDGKSARSLFLTPGSMASAHSPRGKRAGNMLWERYGSDFIYDEAAGKWLYFHEHVCPDFGFSYDTSDWAHNQLAAERGGPGGGPGGPGGGPGGPGGGPGGPGGGPGGPGGGPGGPGGGPGGPGGGPGGPGSGPGKAQTEDSGRVPACIAHRPKKDPPRTDKEKLHWQWSLTQPVQASVSWPVPYETLDDENSYAPGHNDPFKNLAQNQARFMG